MASDERPPPLSDDQLLAVLNRLVDSVGIVEAGKRLRVNYRTAQKCRDSGHVSRRMREVLERYLREHPEALPQADEVEPDEGRGGGLQELEQGLRQELELLRGDVGVLREQLAEGEAPWRPRGPGAAETQGKTVMTVETGETHGADAVEDGTRRRSEPHPRRVFPELITEEAEPGEEQVYGGAADVVVEWRTVRSSRASARHTLDWLRAERRRLQLELRLVGEFRLTPPPADRPWRESRRQREVRSRRRALGRLRWQLPLTWLLHGLLRGLTLGLWGR